MIQATSSILRAAASNNTTTRTTLTVLWGTKSAPYLEPTTPPISTAAPNGAIVSVSAIHSPER